MRNVQKILVVSLLAIATAAALSGCSSTRQQDGVTIEQDRSYNPMGWFK